MSDVEALQEEIAALRSQLAERDARLAELAASEARLKVALLEIEQIKMQLAVLRRQRYGHSSEKLDGEIVQLELRLEDLEENVGEQHAANPRLDGANDKQSNPRRKPTGRKPLPPHLPREVVVHEPQIVCHCGDCDPGRLTKIGETTTEVLEKIPARLKVIRHVRPKYACRRCEMDGGAGHPAVLYRYSADRKGVRPQGHLEGFSGYLHADAFAGYQALYRPNGRNAPRIQHVACFAHARRKLFDVFEATKSPIAGEALQRIQELYAIEEEISGKSATPRRAARQAQAKPLLDAFHTWAVAQRRRLSSKMPLGKAFQYSLSRWDALTRYIEDGRLSIGRVDD